MACLEDHVSALPRLEYAYLLGQYLGDGCLSHIHRGVYRLRIACCDAYPDIMDEVAAATAAVMPKNKVGRSPQVGCTEVGSYSKHWPCFFPQHGPGKKHLREIALQPWQQEVVDDLPEPFLRGLIHSDGYRGINRVHVGGKWYAYPRYQFTNESEDIKRLFTDALDRLEIPWRVMNRKTISVARREGVARLDEFVGPKG